jgi:GT2 family glycosyltransferase
MPTLRPDSAAAAGAARVTIVVLSHNRPDLLARALRSIAHQSHENREVVVVDNASEASERIRSLVAGFDEVRLVANATNRGFTGGMNQGLAEARGDYIYLTEDDIELDRECIAELVRYLVAHPDVALAGPVMWNKQTATIRCAGGSFNLGPAYRLHVTGAGQTDLPDSNPFPTLFIPGSMIAARTAKLRELGGFRSEFFMYGEDVELCARVIERGWTMAIVPAARVYHHEPPDGPEPAVIRFHKQKNLAALYMLHAPFTALPGFFARYFFVDGGRRLLRDRGTLPAWTAAWAVALARSPRLFAERLRRA